MLLVLKLATFDEVFRY